MTSDKFGLYILFHCQITNIFQLMILLPENIHIKIPTYREKNRKTKYKQQVIDCRFNSGLAEKSRPWMLSEI